MELIPGRDWSVGLDSPTSIEQAQLLGLIGRRLRNNYDALVGEPMPDRLAMLVRQLEERLEQSDAGRPDAPAQHHLMATD